MERTNSNSGDANPSEISPSLRRPWRPIGSPFFNQLAFIVSHFSSVPEERAYFSQFLPEHIRPGYRKGESAQANEVEGSGTTQLSRDVIIDGSGSNELERANKKEDSCEADAQKSVEYENLSRKEIMVSESSGVLSKEPGGFNHLGRVMVESGLTRGDEVNDNVISGNSGNGHVSTKGISVQEHLLNLEKIIMDETENVENLQQDTEDSNFHISRALDSYWNMDMILGGSNTIESNEAGGITHTGGIMVKEVGGQKQEKGMDIEKLVSRSDVIDYPHVTLNGGPEEGEIYDCSEVHDLLVDALPEDATVLDMEKRNKGNASEDVLNKDVFTFNSQAVENNKGAGSVCNSEGMLEDECKSQRFEIRTSDGHKKAQKLEVVKRDKKRKDRKAAKDPAPKSTKNKGQAAEAEEVLVPSSACDPVPHNKRFRECKTERKENKSSIKSLQRICYTRDQLLELKEVVAVPKDILKVRQQIEGEICSKDQNLGGGETNADGISLKEKLGPISEKKKEKIVKRKRRPLSEERKAKKKQKERKKRAEKNRKLGVKRLKIQPILKPKTVTHCRHYLKGRCHEGEKCKFSHDVIPLTKSKPCCHFARQTCMKGDDCPFDHQLSKYPCNNYATKGSCIRGDSCMFSHKIAVNEASKSTVGELKSLAPLDNSISEQQVDKESCPSRTLAPVNRKHDNTLCAGDQPAKVPKGLKFFSFGKSLLDDVAKKRQAGTSQESSNGVETGVQPKHGASGRVLNFSGESKGSQALESPRGISSLSFGSQEASFLTKRESELDSSAQNKGSSDKFTQSNFIAQMLQISPVSSGLSSKKAGGGQVKRTLDSAPSALSSTLAFASQYESVIKMKPSKGASSPGSVVGNKTAGSGSSSGGAKNQSMKPSDLFDLLYGGNNETK
ncbi:hypothetical protein Ancab_027502 [Ancistrocladus abbreviatus]